jgi:uncharacterized protein YggU (UPF0235/DUF167 family)
MLVRVKAFPDARKERVIPTGESTYDMYVREPAQHNMANIRVRQLVAVQCGVPLAQVHMQSGARSRSKVFVVQ